MIDVKELRIGNLVNCHNNRQAISIVYKNAVSFDYVLKSQDEYKTFKCNEIDGIPLTEKILLESGFEKLVESLNAPQGSIAVYLLNGVNMLKSSSLSPNSFFYYYDGREEIKYIHQLQNLIFALTGEELDVKL